jgi:hypothetical protein
VRGRPWLPEHDATLAELCKAGLGISIIAERLGRTPNAVSCRRLDLARQELPKPAPPPPKDFLAERIEARIKRLARINRVTPEYIKRECYGWR